MEELKLKERNLMGEEEFADFIKNNKIDRIKDFEKGILHLNTYEAVNKFKSVRRAIKRGHVALDGTIYPKRPFNNAKHSKKSLNNIKKSIYEQLKYRQGKD